MPKRMKCMQITEWGGKLQKAERSLPEIAANDVLVEVEATSVGLTVRNVMNGDLGGVERDLPRIPGHEIVGTVVSTGKGVSHPNEGDRIGAYFYLNCNHCEYCFQGMEPLCENLEGYVSVDIDGGFAEYARLPAENAIRLPESIDPVDATAIPDAIATPYHIANQRAGITHDDEVLVLGAGGGVGVHLVQMLLYFGAAVTAVDVKEDKLRHCRDMGATTTVNTEQRSLSEAFDHEEFKAIVDLTGVPDIVEEAKEYLAPRGRLVNLTTFLERSFELTSREQVLAETEVVGSRYCSKFEFTQAAKLVDEGKIKPVVTEVVELEEVQDLIERIEAGDVIGRGAVRIGNA